MTMNFPEHLIVGVFTNSQTGERYEHEFKHGKRHGKGTYYFPT